MSPCFAMSSLLQGDKRLRVFPLTLFLLELLRLVDYDLPVNRVDSNCITFQRSRSGPFEVDPVEAEARAVARTLDLALAEQHVGRAAEVGARRVERGELRLAVPVLVELDHPAFLVDFEPLVGLVPLVVLELAGL